jgi:hypothetical protein
MQSMHARGYCTDSDRISVWTHWYDGVVACADGVVACAERQPAMACQPQRIVVLFRAICLRALLSIVATTCRTPRARLAPSGRAQGGLKFCDTLGAWNSHEYRLRAFKVQKNVVLRHTPASPMDLQQPAALMQYCTCISCGAGCSHAENTALAAWLCSAHKRNVKKDSRSPPFPPRRRTPPPPSPPHHHHHQECKLNYSTARQQLPTAASNTSA